MSTVIAEFDRIAAAIAADGSPDDLTAAERFLLSQIPPRARRALDVGCGAGALSRELASRGIATVGIDASPGMIELARRRAGASPLLDYRIADVLTEPLPESAFDLVVSVSMAHHVPLERLVPRLAAAVAPGGVLLIQDITTRTGLQHLPENALAWLARRLELLPGKRPSSAIVDLYDAHGAGEEYLLASKVADAYRELLPAARTYLHLEWRYTVVWRRADDKRLR